MRFSFSFSCKKIIKHEYKLMHISIFYEKVTLKYS